eukprot:TRINITY_DN8150_c0_g1_i1.p1 TRINITY_DN8150_c0_g1~~TRINITY_DN8150_c0_g1_i1.p1  ORF type:complete len:551 (+),score=172.65 TRINITY_DN8150_c0_g1_i1:740-2392(+)
MSRIRCAALLVATGGAYRYLSGGVPVHAQAPVLRPLEPHENSKQLAVANAAKQLTVGRAVFYVRVAVRGVLLLTGAILPLMWAFVLHSISHRLVSKQTMHDLMLQFFMSSGPCFLKLGQWAATRPDKFSKEFCEVVGQLHHSAPKHGWEESRQRIVDAYGGLDLFEHVDHEPIHSGCIAQVHRARLKGDRRDMVVKVMHPGVEDAIEVDLKLIRCCVQSLEWAASRVFRTDWLSVRQAMYEFEWLMRSQLDLSHEADNLLQFRIHFNNSKDVHFPMPVMRLATPTVMVQTFEEGVPLQQWLQRNPSPFERLRVAAQGCRVVTKMIKDHNMLHADLHPGNVLIRQQNGPPKLVLVDAGLVACLSPGALQKFTKTVSAALMGQGDQVADSLMYGTPPREGQVSDGPGFRSDINRIVKRAATAVLHRQQVDVPDLCIEVMQSFRHNNINVDPSFSGMVGAVLIAEGLRRTLWPEGSTTQLVNTLYYAENESGPSLGEKHLQSLRNALPWRKSGSVATEPPESPGPAAPASPNPSDELPVTDVRVSDVPRGDHE